ncbi:MAG TPA: hypothetical protein VMZ71_16000 [Gemmataceae bacterium]|nr:hypothetical protein [Gemmataceae bacterium]
MTPRRILMLLGGVLLFCGIYAGYARALGWLDGLPQLPAELLIPGKGDFQPPTRTFSPTVERLKEAFGPECAERDDQAYPTKLEFRNGDSWVVLAARTSPFEAGSKKIILSPFSVAAFGKSKPMHLRQPGEVVEITTFHADKAVLEFDRAINNPNDMNKAKIIRLELVSEPELALPDPRRGTVHITNNQKSNDPNKALVIRTPGPVFYRDPKGELGNAGGPDIATDAAVEIVDRQNLPRGYGAPSPPTAAARGYDLRDNAAVAEILAGHRLPPPTVTAVGLRVYLEQEEKKPAPNVPAPAKKEKKEELSVGGLRRLELQEKVLINLWVDASQSFVSGPAPADDKKGAKSANPLASAETPAGAAGLVGGVMFGVESFRALDKALLQIETLGPFTYDAVTNVGRFDVVPQANPDLPNDVQVSRVPAQGGQNRLFSQVLEIEFNGPPTGPQAKKDAAKPNAKPDDGPTFKRLHAWTYTPGRFLTVSADGEQALEAYGQDLVHDPAANRTTLQGSPLYAVRERNVLTAGAAQKPAFLVMEPGPDKTTTATVRGPGRIELYDSATGKNSMVATWATSLTHAKTTENKRELDLLTFTDDASFKDDSPAADYWLKGKVLKLWIEAAKRDDKKPRAKGEPAPQPLPQRLQAIGNVTSHSAEFDIEEAEFLNVMFRDVPPPAEPKPAASPIPPLPKPAGPMGPMPPAAAQPAPKPVEPPKELPKPPTKLKARTIDTYVVRYPTKPAKADPEKPNAPAMKYELEKARCDGKVVVHQDPEDPEKPRGVDILGATLIIDQTPKGGVMTVTGTDDRPGEVHYDSMSIIGPTVVIDQLRNSIKVTGRGAMQMPAGSDLNGAELAQPEVVTIHWRDKMEFFGATKYAEFFGKVSARQGESWVVCHTMHVTIDRPVYFNNTQARKPEPKKDAKGKDNPSLETVSCLPGPDDVEEDRGAVTFKQVERDAAGKLAKVQQLEAKEIRMNAQARDQGRDEKYQLVVADGPGTLRTWQPGQKDAAAPGAPPATPKADDTEMKLTIVTFGGRMFLKDKGKLYQEAQFMANVRVTSVPADSPEAKVERHNLPFGSVLLTCNDKLLVSSHKKGTAPPVQFMRAEGAAFILSDEYEGWGEVVTYDGRIMNLEGTGNTQARIKSRFKGTSQDGKTIVYDRVTNSYRATDSFGGTIDSNPAPPKKK